GKLTLAAVLACACSGPSETPDAGQPPQDDAGGGTDAGAPDAGVPDAGPSFSTAPHAPLIQVTTAGGPVLATPHLAIATFDGDPLAPQVEAFAQALGASDYWHQVTGEYQVGPITFDRGVHLTGAPASISIEQAGVWLQGQLDGTHPEWGPVDASVIYTVVYPVGTVVTNGGVS